MKQRTTLITGATSGIGLALAVEFWQKTTDNLILHGFRHLESLNNLKLEAKSTDRSLTIIGADLADAESLTNFCRQISHSVPNIDVLINNAAIANYNEFGRLTLTEWYRIRQINLDAPFLITQAALPAMLRQKYGRIINISSMWGQIGASCEVAYSTTKAALNGFTKALAAEVAPSGITVNAVAPGVIDTQMNQHLATCDLAKIIEDIPSNRLGKPSEVASLVRFLATAEASYITGQIIGINGGLVR